MFQHCHFLRATACNASRVLAIVEVSVSVCPPVHLSVTPLSPIKTVDHSRITKSSLWVAARTLVYRDKLLCAWVRGFLSN